MSGATQNKDGSKKKWIHGRAVVDGEVKFLSVSALEKGDSSKPNGCLRRWHYQYIEGIKEPPSEAMADGTRLHEEIAHYLQTGEKVLSAQVMAGLHMIPEPGPDLLIEHDIVPTMPDGKSGLKHAVLKASGIPIVGAIDLIHARGINKGTMDIESTEDPQGTIEVIDWKTCRTLNHAKPGPELLKSIQMVGYGKYVFEAEPEAKLARLSHGYFPKQGSPRKTTIRADRPQIEKAWEHANRVASSIRDAAKEKNPDLVEANTQACNAFGKECPAAKVCSAVKNNVMAKFVGQVLSSQLIPPGNLTRKMETPPNNSILAQIKAKQSGSNLPEPRPNRGVFGTVAVTVTPPAPPTENDDKVAQLKAEIARLEAQEKALKVHDLTLGPELVPPDAPESNPILASKPLGPNSFTEAMAAVVDTTPEVTTEPVEVVVEKKKRGRKPKAVGEQTVVRTPAIHIAPEPEQLELPVREEHTVEAAPPVAAPDTTPDGPINLFVDCDLDGMEAESLWPVIDELCEILNRESNTKDFRISKDLDYGRWKGALAAYIRITPIAGGNYILKDAHSDIGQVVVETMRPIVRRSGGVLVKGAR
jgi:hypothetical protein